jgi:hypothetical protein
MVNENHWKDVANVVQFAAGDSDSKFATGVVDTGGAP